MKKHISKLLVLIILLLLTVSLAGCFGPKEETLVVPVTWAQENYFDGESFDWYAGICEGLYSFVSGMPNEPFQYHAVTPGTNTTVEFTIPIKDYENYTVFIFMDHNGNQQYDSEDRITSYAFGVIGPNDVPTDIELTPYY